MDSISIDNSLQFPHRMDIIPIIDWRLSIYKYIRDYYNVPRLLYYYCVLFIRKLLYSDRYPCSLPLANFNFFVVVVVVVNVPRYKRIEVCVTRSWPQPVANDQVSVWIAEEPSWVCVSRTTQADLGEATATLHQTINTLKVLNWHVVVLAGVTPLPSEITHIEIVFFFCTFFFHVQNSNGR